LLFAAAGMALTCDAGRSSGVAPRRLQRRRAVSAPVAYFFAVLFFAGGACAGRRRSLQRRGNAANKAARRGPRSPAPKLRRCSAAAVFSALTCRRAAQKAVVLATSAARC